MSVLAAALISVLSFVLISWHFKRATLQRIAGYALYFDVALHFAVLCMFMGTSTLGLLQAELSAIFITCLLRGYRYVFGYQRLRNGAWVTYAGLLT